MTDGPRGVELLGPGAAGPVKVSAPAVEEVDATGAGDSFAAAFLTAFSSGATPERAARAACAVAAHSVTVLGAMEADVQRYVAIDRVQRDVAGPDVTP